MKIRNMPGYSRKPTGGEVILEISSEASPLITRLLLVTKQFITTTTMEHDHLLSPAEAAEIRQNIYKESIRPIEKIINTNILMGEQFLYFTIIKNSSIGKFQFDDYFWELVEE
jgi:hypothetical protein